MSLQSNRKLWQDSGSGIILEVKAKIYKFRALLFLFVVKILSKIFFVEIPPIFSVTALISKQGKLLFINLSYLNGLGFPGGVVRAGENLEEALKREVFEETGLTVIDSKYIKSVKGSIKGISTASAVFSVHVTGKTRDSEEGNVVWLEPKDAIGKMAYKSSDNDLKDILKFI